VNVVRRLLALAARLRILQVQSAPSNSEDGRAAARYRLAALGAISTAVSRLAGVALIVLSVRWTTPVLGPERFGVFATFSSLAVMLSFLDLGVGNALVNRVAHAAAKNDSQELSRVVMGGISWLVVIGLGGTVLLAAAGAWIPWSRLFALSSPAIGSETRTAALMYSGLFGLNVVSGGLLKILHGQQRSHDAQMIATIGALIGCTATWWMVRHAPYVGTLLLASVGTQSAAVLVLVLWLLHRRHRLDIRMAFPSMMHERKALLTTSVLFLMLQIGTMIGWGGDNFLLAGIVGASDVAAFAVAQRLFLFASQPVSILNGSLWAAYADAHARNDRRFIRKTLFSSAVASMVVVSTLSILLLFSGQWLVACWTENAIAMPWVLLAAFALWTPLESAGSVLSVYLNGTGIVREQVIVVTCFCIVALPVKIIAAMHAGALGLVTATTAAYAITVAGLYGTLFRRRILTPIRLPARTDDLPAR